MYKNPPVGAGQQTGLKSLDALGQRPLQIQRTHRRGLAGAPVAKHQNTPNAGVTGGDKNRQLHFILAHDR